MERVRRSSSTLGLAETSKMPRTARSNPKGNKDPLFGLENRGKVLIFVNLPQTPHARMPSTSAIHRIHSPELTPRRHG
jgi:hypothetical protein